MEEGLYDQREAWLVNLTSVHTVGALGTKCMDCRERRWPSEVVINLEKIQ